MKKPIIIICYALTLNFVFAESNPPFQTIKGRVTDKNTKIGLSFINIVLLDSEPLKGTSTNDNGYFRLENVEIGRISVKASCVGYLDVVLNNLNLQAGKELILNIEMEEKAIQGKEVVIVGQVEKSAPINKMAVVSARSFTVEESERYAGSRNDVARMAANYAGVLGVDDFRNDIIIRGNSPIGLLWRLEGVDIPSPNHWGMTGTTGGPVCMLNNNLLTNSDFITGAFPAEYGNAISGVFDIKMRSGNNEKFEFLGQVGFNGFELGVEGPLSFNEFASFLINYRYSTLGLFAKLGIDFGTVGIPYYQDLSFKVVLPDTKIGNISFFGLGGISDIKIWESLCDTVNKPTNIYGQESLDLTNGTDMGVVGLTHTYHFSTTLFSKITLSASSQIMQTVVDSLTPITFDKIRLYESKFIDSRISGSLEVTKKIDSRNIAKAGFTYTNIIGNLKDEYLSHGNYYSQFDYNGTVGLLQSFAQYQFRPSDKISLIGGIHYQNFTYNNSQNFEPRLSVKYYLSPKLSVYAGYGIHSQLSSLFSYLHQDKLGYKTNKDLGLTKSHHLIVGSDYKIGEFTRLKTEAYYQHIFNVPVDANNYNSYSMLNSGASFVLQEPEYLINKGKGNNYGIELTLEQFINKGFYYLVTASIYDSKYIGSDNIVHNTAFNNNYVFNALVGKEIKFNNGKTIMFDIKTTYAGGKRKTPWHAELIPGTANYRKIYNEAKAFSSKTKDYFKIDFRISYKINGKTTTQEWGIEITNLFNTKNILKEDFNKQTGEPIYIYQMPFMLIPQWRILF